MNTSSSSSETSSLIKRIFFDAVMFGYFFCFILAAVFRPDETEQLKLVRNLGLFFTGAVGGIAISFLLNSIGLKTLGELIFEPAYKKVSGVSESWFKTVYGWQLALFLVSSLTMGFVITQASIFKLVDIDSLEPVIRLVAGIFQPNWALLPEAVMKMIETIFLAFMATSLAIPVAFVLCFFGAKNIMRGPIAAPIYFLLRFIWNVTRSVEAFVWAIIFSVWVGIGPFAGMLALFIHSIVSLAKQYSEIVETVNDGPIEGIQSTGANRVQTVWFAVVPQVILPFISFTIYRWDINIRMATIVGFVGGGGIGSLLQTYQGQAMWSEVGTIIVVIAFVVLAMDLASAYLREALK
jgi:phosphonate transport system permease protein